MQVRKVLKKDNSTEVSSLKELNELSAQTKATTNDIVNIMPEIKYQLEACNCRPNSQTKLTRLCNECYRLHLDTEIELCAVGKKDDNSNNDEAPTTLKEALEHLDKVNKKSKNIKVILEDMHEMIKSSKALSIENEIVKKYAYLIDYVKTNPNCNCNYCQAKEEIPFLQHEHFLPQEIFCSFDQEKVGVELNLPEYCAVFLFVLYLEQHRYFPKQIIALTSKDRLESSDVIASVSPFYHGKRKLLHVGQRIAAHASGNRSQEFRENIVPTINLYYLIKY